VGPGCGGTRVSSLGEVPHPTLAPGALPWLSLFWRFLWHEPVYVPGWTEALRPRELTFPCPWLACPITASLPYSLHHCVPGWLAPSLHHSLHHCVPGLLAPLLHPRLARSISAPSVFPGKAEVKASLCLEEIRDCLRIKDLLEGC